MCIYLLTIVCLCVFFSEQCTASASNCELRDENATLFPGVWQKVACSDWAPAVDFSYRMFQANPGDGLCQAFVKGWGFLPQCNRQVLGDGSVVWLKPICYTNETTLQAFSDDQCLSGNSTILWSLPTAPLWARCSRDLVDNHTFYLTTCPTVIANSAAALLPLLLLLFSLLLVSIIN